MSYVVSLPHALLCIAHARATLFSATSLLRNSLCSALSLLHNLSAPHSLCSTLSLLHNLSAPHSLYSTLYLLHNLSASQP